MSSSVKVGNTWRNIPSKHTKQSGTWHEIVKGLEKKDGVWIVYYSSGALVGFTNYPDPIPVMAGWQYKTNGATSWTDITSDGEINTSGTFTGTVKVKGTLTLDEWFTEEGVEIGEQGLRMDGTPLSLARSFAQTVVVGEYGCVCGGDANESGLGEMNGPYTIDAYDTFDNITTVRSSGGTYEGTSFVLGSKGFVCGGLWANYEGASTSSKLLTIDSTLNTTVSSSNGHSGKAPSSFVLGDKGYVCGTSSNGSAVSVIDSSGNKTTGTDLSQGRGYSATFVIGGKGYVCGGNEYVGMTYADRSRSTVDIYDSSGNRTTGTALSVARSRLCSFSIGERGFACGGAHYPNSSSASYYSTVDVYDSSGNRTTGTSLSIGRTFSSTFTLNNRGYVCGGIYHYYGIPVNTVDIYDSTGNRTTGTSLSESRGYMPSFVNGNKGYVCGGAIDYAHSNYSEHTSKIDIYYDEEIPYTIAKIPITAGTSYTLNGTGGTAASSQVLTFNEKVSGTVEYKKGEIPS